MVCNRILVYFINLLFFTIRNKTYGFASLIRINAKISNKTKQLEILLIKYRIRLLWSPDYEIKEIRHNPDLRCFFGLVVIRITS